MVSFLRRLAEAAGDPERLSRAPTCGSSRAHAAIHARQHLAWISCDHDIEHRGNAVGTRKIALDRRTERIRIFDPLAATAEGRCNAGEIEVAQIAGLVRARAEEAVLKPFYVAGG